MSNPQLHSNHEPRCAILLILVVVSSSCMKEKNLFFPYDRNAPTIPPGIVTCIVIPENHCDLIAEWIDAASCFCWMMLVVVVLDGIASCQIIKYPPTSSTHQYSCSIHHDTSSIEERRKWRTQQEKEAGAWSTRLMQSSITYIVLVCTPTKVPGAYLLGGCT